MLNLDSLVDMNIYNDLVKMKGGSPIITKKKLISMKAFISVLLKLFRKDYENKLRKIKGGFYTDSISDLGLFNVALKYGDLNYTNSYEFPSLAQLERDIV